jgi:hypothetical protein
MDSKKTTSGNRLDVGWQYGINVDKNSRSLDICIVYFTMDMYEFLFELSILRCLDICIVYFTFI